MFFTPQAKRVLELSCLEADQAGEEHIGTEHLLLGLLSHADGVAAQVLGTLGLEHDPVREVVRRLLDEHSGPEAGTEFGRNPTRKSDLAETPDDYRRLVRNPALERRFQPVEVVEHDYALLTDQPVGSGDDDLLGTAGIVAMGSVPRRPQVSSSEPTRIATWSSVRAQNTAAPAQAPTASEAVSRAPGSGGALLRVE